MKTTLILLLLLLSGCNVVGYAAYAMRGPTKVPAAYDLAAEPTLLVVENAKQPQVGEILAEQLASLVADKLEKAAPTVVLVDEFEELSFAIVEERKSLRQMGEDAGATRVVYIDLQNLRVRAITGTDSYVGRAEVSVKVLDVTTGTIAFPTTQSGGVPVTAQTEREPFENRRPGEVRTQVLNQLATNIARLFYDHSIEEKGLGGPDDEDS
ncbi:MAG: hypothetical protein AAGD32_14400 [Planctomycetota bacterium]